MYEIDVLSPQLKRLFFSYTQKNKERMEAHICQTCLSQNPAVIPSSNTDVSHLL